MPRLLQTSAAKQDLLEIGRYIAAESQSLETALNFLDKIEKKCLLYATQPHMAAPRPDLGDQRDRGFGWRRFPRGPTSIVDGGEVEHDAGRVESLGCDAGVQRGWDK
ncbi:MAG: type II toxin-antitoxin system RelE/ParE family toxin [Pirellulaceae bacterium]|jgi:plasmid stabilization system protein ParE|nr:type II toxin-antitoxin system RelE/ParE family toxin [Pirellulaceae bacterium]